MTVFQFIILSLAVYRLTVLIARDVGPFNLCFRLRQRFRVFKCPFCIGIWVSAAVNLTFYLACVRSELVVLLALIFAMSAIAIMLDRTFSADYEGKFQ